MSDGNLTELESLHGLNIIMDGMRSQLRWSLGIFFALIIFGAGWMINISAMVNSVKEDTILMLSVLSKQNIATDVSVVSLALRISVLETERNKGDRFTAADGKILEERVRSLEQLTDYYHPPKILKSEREKAGKTK